MIKRMGFPRARIVVRLALALALSGALCGCRGGDGGARPEALAEEVRGGGAAQPTADAVFIDRGQEVGLDVVHFNGMSGELFLSEITCGGGALVDIDGDGDLDVYVAQGRMVGADKTLDDALLPPHHPPPVTDRLYRNDLDADGSRRWAFTDITAAMGVVAGEYGCGVAAADYDHDGRVDLFLANLGPDQLLRNLGPDASGAVRFEEVAGDAGVGSSGASTVAAFFDYDRDGWLDLYVGRYVAFDDTGATRCASLSGAPDYCGPGAFASEPDHLYRNRGDGTFEDVSRAVGLRSVAPQPSLGAVVADFNGDTWPDLYIAHDGEANHLWINERDASGRVTFSEQGLLAGGAVNGAGAPEAGMGVDAADYDDDGDFDIFVAHLVKETNTLYRNSGDGIFTDATAASGLGSASLPRTSFGAAWLDYDNDGRLDLMVASGGVVLDPRLVAAGDPFPLHMENQLFRNLGQDDAAAQAGSPAGPVRFDDVTAAAGQGLALSEVSRGLAVGDLDNDGDPDAVVFNNGGRLRMLVNTLGQDQHWVGARPVLGDPPRDALGARVAVLRDGRTMTWRRVRTSGSYNVARDPRVLMGLGGDPRFDGLRVVWPDGATEDWRDLDADRYHVLRRGQGQAVEAPR